MGLSVRLFLIDSNDTIYRLSNAKFSRMLIEPRGYCYPKFAGHRIRYADVIVALEGRIPVQVLRVNRGLLPFDASGYLDVQNLWRRQSARAEQALHGVLDRLVSPEATLVEASCQFIVQGDQWKLTGSLADRLGAAALGEYQCPRI